MQSHAASLERDRRSSSVLALQPVEIRAVEEVRVPILLIDCRPLTRELTSKWLETSCLGPLVFTLSSPNDLADRSDLPNDIHLILFNIGAAQAIDPEVVRGLDLLSQKFPAVPAVLYAEREEMTEVAAAVRYGVRGYIPSSLSPEVVIEALRLIRAGGTFIPASILAKAADQRQPASRAAAPGSDSRLDDFTPRELEVLDRLRQGTSNKIIAHELNICDGTVKVHIKHIMRKLKVTNRTQAALVASKIFDGSE
jgi:DNA-binding NarL/FixJ family response regulator